MTQGLPGLSEEPGAPTLSWGLRHWKAILFAAGCLVASLNWMGWLPIGPGSRLTRVESVQTVHEIAILRDSLRISEQNRDLTARLDAVDARSQRIERMVCALFLQNVVRTAGDRIVVQDCTTGRRTP